MTMIHSPECLRKYLPAGTAFREIGHTAPNEWHSNPPACSLAQRPAFFVAVGEPVLRRIDFRLLYVGIGF